MKSIIKNESLCFALASAFLCTYVLFMHFVFNRALADSNIVILFVQKMEILVPSIKNLHHDDAEYTNYWGAFYAFFWITTPIYWALGFCGASLLGKDRYQKLVVDTTVNRVLIILLLCSIGVAYGFMFPILSGMMIINQMSDFLPILILSWWLVAGIIYYHAQIFRVVLIKLNHSHGR